MTDSSLSSSLNPRGGVPEQRRIHTSELVVVQTHSASSSASSFNVKLSQPLDRVISVQLLEVVIRGVPVTSGEPDYPFFHVGLDRISPNSAASDSTSNALTVLLTGGTTHTVYSPPRTVREDYTPFTISTLAIRLVKPDGDVAISNTDVSGVYMVFRVIRDQNAPMQF